MEASGKGNSYRHQQKYHVKNDHAGYREIAEQNFTLALQGI